MGNFDRIISLLNEGKEVYMKDDFYDVAIRIAGGTEAYLKHKGRAEVRVPHGYKLVCEIEMGGEFIDKAEYDAY